MRTIVYQSFRRTDIPPWIETCLDSVKAWAAIRGYSYRFYDDEIFDRVPPWVLEKTGKYRQTATDLGRLMLARELLHEGFDRVVWLDADILVFLPDRLTLAIDRDFSFGRENWVQSNKNGGIKVYKNVHNAISVFCKGNSFLEFYIYSSLRILERAVGPLVPQIIGPKYLTAMHNIIGFNLIDEVGMASPRVIDDLAGNGGGAWDLLKQSTPNPICAVNLCSSLSGDYVDDVQLNDTHIDQAISTLMAIH